MSRHGTIRRYTLILEKITRNQFPTFAEIKEYLFNFGFEVSSRTIQRDIEQIRYEFGIEILYDKKKRGYFIDYENSLNIESFFRFLEIVNTAELLTESLSNAKKTLQHIMFENNGDLRGIEHLKPLLQAINENRVISFTHYNFVTGKTKHFELEPYLLREYQGRWYIWGIETTLKTDRMFGLDRITNLELTDKVFTPDKSLNPSEYFENVVGVNYSNLKTERIVLSFTPTQGKFIKSLPIHKSQKILVDDDENFVVELQIVPNYEFIQKIFMFNTTVKVLEPHWLVDEVKERLQEMLNMYE